MTAKIVRIGMTREEAEYLLEWCDSVIGTEKSSITDFADEADKYKKRWRFWRRLKKELKEKKRGTTKAH